MIETYVDDVLAIDFFRPRLRPGQPRCSELRRVSAAASHHHVHVVAHGMPAEAGRRRLEAVLHGVIV